MIEEDTLETRVFILMLLSKNLMSNYYDSRVFLLKKRDRGQEGQEENPQKSIYPFLLYQIFQ